MEKERLVIIGCGPAGLTAAIYAARASLSPLVISGQLPGGLLTQTSEVENFPGFEDGVNGYELMDKMDKQAKRFGARVIFDQVSSVNFTDGETQTLKLMSGKEIEAEAVIIAAGATPRWLGLDSEERLKNRGVSACATCDGAFYRNMDVAVAGGGDSAMEEATFLTKFASKVYLIHRRDEFRASPIMVERAKANPKIEIITNAVIDEILGEKEVEGIAVHDVKTQEKREIPCKGFFAALGHIPATALYKDFIETDDKGYIILQNNRSQTSLKGIFAAGDCADPVYRQAIHAAGMGCAAAMDAIKYLEEK
ncbi:MAG: thioredoxin-disulfide reductase [Lentisphaeria bacterium]|nr:thioredoxin-disulfide reductase [Lentisphaeria bacterium]